MLHWQTEYSMQIITLKHIRYLLNEKEVIFLQSEDNIEKIAYNLLR